MFARKALTVLVAALLTLPLLAQKYDPRFDQSYELVQSIPAETDYGQLRFRQTRRVWLDMIGSASRTIDLELFYLRDEPARPLEEVVHLLQFAAGQGVKVRVLADLKYRDTYPECLAQLQKTPNVEVRLLPMAKLAGGVLHAKYILADGCNLFVGSQNFDWTSLSQIREIGARVRDRRLGECLAQIFELDWALAKDPQAPVPHASHIVDAAHPVVLDLRGDIVDGEHPFAGGPQPEKVEVYPAFSPPQMTPAGLAREEDELVKMIGAAREELKLQVMTYSTTDYTVLDEALRAAAARGVRVQLIIAHWGAAQPALGQLRQLAQVPHVEIKVNTIPPFSGGEIPFARVNHSKFMVTDQLTSWVGTSNWERGYFHQCRDVSLFFRGALVNRQLRRAFDYDWNSPYCKSLPTS